MTSLCAFHAFVRAFLLATMLSDKPHLPLLLKRRGRPNRLIIPFGNRAPVHGPNSTGQLPSRNVFWFRIRSLRRVNLRYHTGFISKVSDLLVSGNHEK